MDANSLDGTGRDFVDHWDWAASKGLINRNTANALKAAASRVLAIEGEGWEGLDVRSIDIDDLLNRFEILAKKDFTPESLATYRSRFKRAHRSYLEFLRDPRNYRPNVRDRSASSERATTTREKLPNRKRASGDPNPRPTFVHSTNVQMMRYPFPVRDGVIAELVLPVNLRPDEAKRLAAFLEALALEAIRLLPPSSSEGA